MYCVALHLVEESMSLCNPFFGCVSKFELSVVHFLKGKYMPCVQVLHTQNAQSHAEKANISF